MTKQEFQELVHSGPVLLDGAVGSVLLERGMPRGTPAELWADAHPEVVLELQRAYVDAGSRILYAPTFQAQPAALREAGMEARTEALNARLVQLTRRAAGPGVWVAGDLATMAASLESFRPENFHTMTELYRRQIAGLLTGGSGDGQLDHAARRRAVLRPRSRACASGAGGGGSCGGGL